ncbi:hypothetical protein D3C78_1729800 [compost metagenome]
MIFIVTYAGTKFNSQVAKRPIEDLATITAGQRGTGVITVEAVTKPTCLTEQVVAIGQVITGTATGLILFRRAHVRGGGVVGGSPQAVGGIAVEPGHAGVGQQGRAL